MTPATILLVSQLIEEGIAIEPSIALAFQKLFASGIPTAADFAAFRASIAAETYKLLVPNSDLSAATLDAV